MPVLTTYPGVYIEEIQSGIPTITGVATSIAAFVGYTEQGPVNTAVQIFSFADFQRSFGGMTVDSSLSYAVNQFFQNGGTDAYVVRVASGATSAQILFACTDSNLAGQNIAGIQVTASSDGTWGNLVRLSVDYDTSNPDSWFSLTVTQYVNSNGTLVAQATETYPNLSTNPLSPNYLVTKISALSQLIEASFKPAGNFINGYSQGGVLPATLTSLTTTQNRIAISIDGSMSSEIAIFPSSTNLTGQNLSDLLSKVAAGMQAAINTAFGAGKATVAVSATNNFLTITSQTASQSSAIRITNASQNDACGVLMLGVANGGYEKEGAAGYRPVQNGTVSGNLTLPLAAASLGGGGALTVTQATTGGKILGQNYYALLTALDANGMERLMSTPITITVPTTTTTNALTFNIPNLPAGFTPYRIYLGTVSGKYDLGSQAIAAGQASVPVTDPTALTPNATPPSGGSIALNLYQAGATTPINATPIVLPLWPAAGATAPTTMSGIALAITTALAKVSGTLKQYVAGATAEYQELLTGTPPMPGNFLRIVPGLPNAYFEILNYGDNTADLLLLTAGNISSLNYGVYVLGSGLDSANNVTSVLPSGTVPGNNGTIPTSAADYGDQVDKTGLYSLDNVDLFNIMCLPDVADSSSLTALYPDVIEYCKLRRAMLIVDLPSTIVTIAGAQNWLANLGATLEFNNVVAYFPRILAADPLQPGTVRQFPNCGAMAGIWANTDANRGVWKAPAGTQAIINGATGLAYRMNDSENGVLNPVGLNCLRTFPVIGTVVWGARTMRGADLLEDDYKYIPVRRLALFLEESLYRGTQWVVFEPNDEPLWAAIRLSVGSFMHSLFRQGAFAGTTPQQAYFVKCSSETTTPYDQEQGRVNIIVGFAPLYPAEFVVIQIQQISNLGPT